MTKSSKRLWRSEYGWMLGVAIVIVLGFWWVPERSDLPTDSFSAYPSGKLAFYRVIQKTHAGTTRSLESIFPAQGEPDVIVILGPQSYPDEATWRQLYDWVYFGGSLIFAARWNEPVADLGPFGMKVVHASTPYPKQEDEETETAQFVYQNSPKVETEPIGTKSPEKADGESNKQDDDDEESEKPRNYYRWDDFSRAKSILVEGSIEWNSFGRIDMEDPSDAEVLVSAADVPQVVRRSIGSGSIIVSASDDLFSNQSMVDEISGLLAYRVFESADVYGAIVFDESLNRAGSPKVFGILFDPEFRPITLQLVLFTVLFGWWGSRRFGPKLEVKSEQRRNITEHAKALGTLHYKVGGGDQALKWYFEFFREELRLESIAMAGQQESSVLARQAGMDEKEVRELLDKVRDNIERRVPTSGTAASLIRSLAQLKDRITPK